MAAPLAVPSILSSLLAGFAPRKSSGVSSSSPSSHQSTTINMLGNNRLPYLVAHTPNLAQLYLQAARTATSTAAANHLPPVDLPSTAPARVQSAFRQSRNSQDALSLSDPETAYVKTLEAHTQAAMTFASTIDDVYLSLGRRGEEAEALEGSITEVRAYLAEEVGEKAGKRKDPDARKHVRMDLVLVRPELGGNRRLMSFEGQTGAAAEAIFGALLPKLEKAKVMRWKRVFPGQLQASDWDKTYLGKMVAFATDEDTVVPLAGWFFGNSFVLGYVFFFPPPHPHFPCLAISPLLNITDKNPSIYTPLILAFLDPQAPSIGEELVKLHLPAATALLREEEAKESSLNPSYGLRSGDQVGGNSTGQGGGAGGEKKKGGSGRGAVDAGEMTVIDTRARPYGPYGPPPSHAVTLLPSLPTPPPSLPPSPSSSKQGLQSLPPSLFPISLVDGPITGGTSKVYFGVGLGGQPLALKYAAADSIDDLRAEANIYSIIANHKPSLNLQNPYFYGLFRADYVAEGGVLILLEDVGDAVDSLDDLSKEDRTSIFESLTSLHSLGILHGDLAPRNLIKRATDDKMFIVDFTHSELHECPGEGCLELAQARLDLLGL